MDIFIVRLLMTFSFLFALPAQKKAKTTTQAVANVRLPPISFPGVRIQKLTVCNTDSQSCEQPVRAADVGERSTFARPEQTPIATPGVVTTEAAMNKVVGNEVVKPQIVEDSPPARVVIEENEVVLSQPTTKLGQEGYERLELTPLVAQEATQR